MRVSGRKRRRQRVACLRAAVATAAVLVAASRIARATVVYSDDFNRATLNVVGGNAYALTVTAGDGGASIDTGRLALSNDATAAPNANGAVFVTTPTAAYAAPFNPVLNDNAGSMLTWTFNLQQSRSNPGGFGLGSFGAAYVLGATSSALGSSGGGYAVVIGNGGSRDPVRLIRYAQGLAAIGSTAHEPTATFLAASEHASSNFQSVKVVYHQPSNTWELLTRDDGTAGFGNPQSPAGYVSAGLAVESSFTSVALTHSGAYWAYGTAENERLLFDNVTLRVEPDVPVDPPRALIWDGDGPAGQNPSDVSGTWDDPQSWWHAAEGAHVEWRSSPADEAIFGGGSGAKAAVPAAGQSGAGTSGGGASGAATTTVTLNATQTAQHVTFAASAPSSPTYVLSGATLQIQSGVTAHQSATLDCPVQLAGPAQTWTVAAGQTLEVRGALSGVAPISKAGDGTLLLASANPAFAGALNVGAGTVRVAHAGALGASAVTVGSGGTMELSAGLLAGPAITLSNGGSLRAVAADVTCARAIELAGSGGAIYVAGGFDATFTGAVTGSATLTKNGPGSLSVASVRTAGLTVAEGEVRLIGATSVVNALSIAAAARLDLRDRALIIRGGDRGTWNGEAYSGVTGLIQTGRNEGTWTGLGGIVTSIPEALTDYVTLAVATADELDRVGDNFGGITASSGDVLVAYTYGGDANLDGVINIDDYGQIDFNVGLSGVVFGYFNGDFNYDGLINIDDYGIIDFNIGIQGPPLGAAVTSVAAVPEPAGVILLPLLLPLRRRRRR